MARAHTNSARLDLRDLVNPAGALTLARLPLALVFAVWADRPAVALGLFDAPTGLRISKHTFVGDKGDYYEIDDGVPQSDAF